NKVKIRLVGDYPLSPKSEIIRNIPLKYYKKLKQNRQLPFLIVIAFYQYVVPIGTEKRTFTATE
ncbi:MAG: hypothetical protein LBG58_06505, partial [Planctomycetaceae bacterium]|nr:hypothetical protein [Planctomycetaceae bacterium]